MRAYCHYCGKKVTKTPREVRVAKHGVMRGCSSDESGGGGCDGPT